MMRARARSGQCCSIAGAAESNVIASEAISISAVSETAAPFPVPDNIRRHMFGNHIRR